MEYGNTSIVIVSKQYLHTIFPASQTEPVADQNDTYKDRMGSCCCLRMRASQQRLVPVLSLVSTMSKKRPTTYIGVTRNLCHCRLNDRDDTICNNNNK